MQAPARILPEEESDRLWRFLYREEVPDREREKAGYKTEKSWFPGQDKSGDTAQVPEEKASFRPDGKK